MHFHPFTLLPLPLDCILLSPAPPSARYTRDMHSDHMTWSQQRSSTRPLFPTERIVSCLVTIAKTPHYPLKLSFFSATLEDVPTPPILSSNRRTRPTHGTPRTSSFPIWLRGVWLVFHLYTYVPGCRIISPMLSSLFLIGQDGRGPQQLVEREPPDHRRWYDCCTHRRDGTSCRYPESYAGRANSVVLRDPHTLHQGPGRSSTLSTLSASCRPMPNAPHAFNSSRFVFPEKP